MDNESRQRRDSLTILTFHGTGEAPRKQSSSMLMSEIKTLADELKTSQNSVLQRIEQFCTSQEEVQKCKCSHRTEFLREDISNLQSHFEELMGKVKTDDRRQEKINSDVRTFESRLDSIESLLLSKQTDDSKLSNTRRKIKTIQVPKSVQPCTKPLKNDADFQARKVEGQDEDDKKANGIVGVVNEFEQRPKRDIKQPCNISMPLQKPNFTIKKETRGIMFHEVGLVEQNVRLVYDGESHWRYVAQNELDLNRSRFHNLDGIHSIICLDISKSMSEGDGWTQARTFLTDYLNGLEEMSKQHNLKTEHVALITFGHETKFQKKFTDKYSEVLEHIGNLKLGGPSQMYGGLLYALSGVWCFRQAAETLGNGSHVFAKIILISDGKPTEVDLVAGPDIEDSSKIDETKAKILQEMENFRKCNADVFFVPVGNSDMTFHKTMESCSDGVMLTYKSGKRLARRQYLSSQLLDPLGLVAGGCTFGSENNFSKEDKEDMRNIQQREQRVKTELEQSTDREEIYFENSTSGLPAVGSRVRRGPDWIHKMQDSNGPGTVIGHSDDGQQVWVEWDTDRHRNIYRYGYVGYDVILVDEPRVLNPGQTIAVGCEVIPGKDWTNITDRRKNGVVIRLFRRGNKAVVRWDDGTRGDYVYGATEEIKINSRPQKRVASEGSQKTENHLHTLDDSRIAQTIEEYAARQKVNKNKNKT